MKKLLLITAIMFIAISLFGNRTEKFNRMSNGDYEFIDSLRNSGCAMLPEVRIIGYVNDQDTCKQKCDSTHQTTCKKDKTNCMIKNNVVEKNYYFRDDVYYPYYGFYSPFIFGRFGYMNKPQNFGNGHGDRRNERFSDKDRSYMRSRPVINRPNRSMYRIHQMNNEMRKGNPEPNRNSNFVMPRRMSNMPQMQRGNMQQMQRGAQPMRNSGSSGMRNSNGNSGRR